MALQFILRSLAVGLLVSGLSTDSASAQSAKKPALGKLAPSLPVKNESSLRSDTYDLLAEINDGRRILDFIQAADIAERASKMEPGHRLPLLFLGVYGSYAASASNDETQKLDLLKRARTALADLRQRFAPLDQQEQKFAPLELLAEARIDALEGRPEAGIPALIKIDMNDSQRVIMSMQVDEIAELQAIRAMPNYRVKMREALAPDLATALAANKPFPFDFDLKDVDGKSVRLADFRGNVTIVDVWGTWCGPCKEEVPHFVELVKKYGDKGFRMVGINCRERGTPDLDTGTIRNFVAAHEEKPALVSKTIRDFVAANGINYPCLLNDGQTEEKIPNFEGYPTTLFLDRSGKVRLKLVGSSSMDRLESIVLLLLAEADPAASHHDQHDSGSDRKQTTK